MNRRMNADQGRTPVGGLAREQAEDVEVGARARGGPGSDQAQHHLQLPRSCRAVHCGPALGVANVRARPGCQQRLHHVQMPCTNAARIAQLSVLRKPKNEPDSSVRTQQMSCKVFSCMSA